MDQPARKDSKAPRPGPVPAFSPDARKLCRWFAQKARDLPWRGIYTPYGVWVSEIMLQQTRVSVAVPYYLRWMDGLPDLRALASAPRDRVLKLWEGLGYYQRPRNLHRAARILCEERQCRVPEDLCELRRLPGLGDYTAAALCSIAFQKPTPAVDANVRRVFARLWDRPGQGAGFVPEIKAAVARMMDIAPPRDVTQALMELGALLCKRENPACGACPLGGECMARARRTQALRPARPRKKAPTPLRLALGVLTRDRRFLVRRRPDTGLMAGLWEFPGARLDKNEDPAQALLRLFEKELGLAVIAIGPLRSIDFSYTTFRVSAQAFSLKLSRGAKIKPGPDLRLVSGPELARLPMPAAYRRLADDLMGAMHE